MKATPWMDLGGDDSIAQTEAIRMIAELWGLKFKIGVNLFRQDTIAHIDATGTVVWRCRYPPIEEELIGFDLNLWWKWCRTAHGEMYPLATLPKKLGCKTVQYGSAGIIIDDTLITADIVCQIADAYRKTFLPENAPPEKKIDYDIRTNV